MSRRPLLVLAAAAAALALAFAAAALHRWQAERRVAVPVEPGTVPGPRAEAPPPAAESRLPPAGSEASRRGQLAMFERLQQAGVAIVAAQPRPAAEFAGRGLPAVPGWPGAVLDLRGRASFAAVAAALAALAGMETAVLPLELELSPPVDRPADGTLDLHLVVAL